MTISYLIDYDLDDNSGVIQKIKQNASQWTKKGHEVYFVSSKTMSAYDAEQNIIFREKTIELNLGRVGTAFNLLYNSYYIHKLLKKIEFDIIYMRYRLYVPFYNNILKHNKVIMEINGDDSIEYKLHSKLTHYYNKFTRKFILKHVDAFVSVSHELKERFEYLQKPIVVIANGIDTTKYSMKKTNNKKPIFVFIATPNQPWQGIDKILSMANHFMDYQFYIIGTAGDNHANIKYFGYLSEEKSKEIIGECDIGIGTLSLYKQGLNEASPLKTRQYLASGLPIIYAYKDTDISDDMEFALKFKNKENNIDYKEIEKFIQHVFKNHTIRLEARECAVQALDYSIKEQKRLTYFKDILDEK